MRNTGLDEAQAGIKIAGRNISNFKNFFFYWSIVDFFGRNDAKAETPVLWPPRAKG